eukprot:CAMPEP_0167831454 /NCGR_PEP_ID=MMETSP0112_2-20121227/13646_1 /TAXON_ID=91324 /ORGANISM="Lotharella globosa, Strain CCCM811" /LENGTH=42 /DNA_ID= /DNA_START= /DNA_END= /DNA_ORIENTATION=
MIACILLEIEQKGTKGLHSGQCKKIAAWGREAESGKDATTNE